MSVNINLKQTKDAFRKIAAEPECLKPLQDSINDFFGGVGGAKLNNAERRYILQSLLERAHLVGATENAQGAGPIPIVAVQ